MRDDQLLDEEIRLIVSLLEATAEGGSLTDSQHKQWQEARSQYQTAAPFPQGARLYRLLAEFGASGAIRENWIQQRWLALRTRIELRNSPKRRR